MIKAAAILSILALPAFAQGNNCAPIGDVAEVWVPALG